MSDGGQLSGRGQAPAEAHRPVSRAAATADLLALRAELARLQKELATAEEQARAAADLDRLKEEFIATASHELKAPLATLRGYSQLLLRRLQRPQPDLELLARGLAQIDAQAQAMARLLDDLLDASRLQAGHFPLRTAPCDLGECLDSVLARLDPGARERVRVQLPDAPVAGNWEGVRIQQVLANLVGNALKYSPPETTVQVRVEWRDAHLQVGVIDSGMGIPPEELARLFQRFHRTPQAIASGLPGTGLGLYLCRGIIEAHGGRLWAASEGVGHGATFQFTLPRHASVAAPRQADGERKGSAR
jgi:signal transduction histidine kinase